MTSPIDDQLNSPSNRQGLMDSIYAMAMNPPEPSDSERLILAEINQHKDRYTRLREVAQGGVKCIYLVDDHVTGRNLAMAIRKQHTGNPSKDEVFLREARITSALQHPNIIPIYDMGIQADGCAFFTMKYIQGQSLKTLLSMVQNGSTQNGATLSARLDIFVKVCEAVAYAHHNGVLHLDLKPANIQVSDYGEVLLCDWGLAEITDAQCHNPRLERYSFDKEEQRSLKSGQIKGTPGYMAPEQLQRGGKKDQRTDIFALGSILFEITKLEKLLDGSEAQIIHQTQINPRLKLNDIPAQNLMAIAAKALQFEPGLRYQRVDELLNDLHAYRNGFASQAESAPLPRQLVLFYKRHRSSCTLSLAFFLFSFLGAIVAFTSIRKSEQAAIEARDSLISEKKTRHLLGRAAAPRYRQKAIEQMANGQMELAVENAHTATVLDSSDALNHNLLASLYFLQKRYDLAALHYRPSLTQLEGKIEKLNTHLLSGQLNKADEITHRRAVLNYANRLIPSPLSTALYVSLLTDRDQDLRRLAAETIRIRINLPQIMSVLDTLEDSPDRYLRQKVLREILTRMDASSEWIQRRIPATRALAMSTNPKMRARFQQLIPANVALGQPVISSGGDERAAQSAVDGMHNDDSMWAATPFPAHISVDLGQISAINTFKIYFYYKEKRFYQYKIQVSNDGREYQTVVDQTANTELASKQGTTHTVPTLLARYVRLVITHNSANESVHVREFEVYRNDNDE